jgi:hypothetical protein
VQKLPLGEPFRRPYSRVPIICLGGKVIEYSECSPARAAPIRGGIRDMFVMAPIQLPSDIGRRMSLMRATSRIERQ